MTANTPRNTRQSRKDELAEELTLPSLTDRMALARQTHNPLTRVRDLTVEVTSGIEPTAAAAVAGTSGSRILESVYEIPLDQIDPNPYNARFIYREDRVKEMAISLAADGQIQPALATLRNGRYVLAAGHFRFRGAKVAGLPTLKLIVKMDMTDQQLFEMSYKENNEREGQSALDNALAWSHALKGKIYASEKDLAEANNISLPTVNKTLALLSLPEDTLDEVKLAPNVFGLSVLYELMQFSKHASAEQTLAMVKQIRDGEKSRRDIEAARQALEHPKERKQREGARRYPIKSGRAEIGAIKEWDSGKVLLEIQVDDPTKRSELVAELCKRFELGSE